MQRSEPSASAGFKRFEASIEPPLVAPAPTSMWISSMKRMAPGFCASALTTRPSMVISTSIGAQGMSKSQMPWCTNW